MNNHTRTDRLGHMYAGLRLSAACATLLSCALVRAETWTQTAAASYDWNNTDNWGGVSFPNAQGATAMIGADFAGAQTINLNAATTVGALTFSDTGSSPDSAVTIATGTPGGALTFSVASGNATLTNSSAGVTNIISAPVVFASNTTINPGSAASGATQGVSLSGGFSGAGNITVGGSASGSGRSTVTLGGANTDFTGGWTLNGTTGTNAQSGAGISISQDSNLGAVPVSPTNQITISNSPVIRFTAGFTLNANRHILLDSGSTLTLLSDGGYTGNVAGNITGDGGLRFNSNALTRIIRLSGTNTYTGGTNVASSLVQAGSTSAFGTNSAVVIANGTQARLDLNNFNNAIGSLSGGGTSGGNVTLGSATLTTGGNNASTTYSGVISGTGGFTKTGTGTQTLSGDNTYSGATTVSGGTLALGAAERIANTSSLVLEGGTFATGGFSETLGILDLNSSSILDFGSGASALAFADSHSISWSGTLTLLNFDINTDSLKFGSTSGGLLSEQLQAISLAGYTASLDEAGFVTFTAIPEPSTYALLAAGLSLAVTVFRSRKRA